MLHESPQHTANNNNVYGVSGHHGSTALKPTTGKILECLTSRFSTDLPLVGVTSRSEDLEVLGAIWNCFIRIKHDLICWYPEPELSFGYQAETTSNQVFN